jgi:hypothetical protein
MEETANGIELWIPIVVGLVLGLIIQIFRDTWRYKDLESKYHNLQKRVGMMWEDYVNE